jgi:peptidoglycan/LPS O-acetylase OafA/YrhL
MLRRIPQVDAVRGIAILFVIFHNEAAKYPSLGLQSIFAHGWMGVDLFFVLSGFLITGILLDSKSSHDYLKNFYARRCLRIWPLYYAVLAFMFVVVPVLRPSEAHTIFAERSSPWWAYPLFLQNFLVPIPALATGPLGVTWSLAIEELFYLVWPWIVRLGSPALLRWGAFAVVAFSPAMRLILAHYDVILYSNPFCRLDGLMAGALLASLVRTEGFVAKRYIPAAWITLLVAGSLALLVEATEGQWLAFSFVAIASAAFVYLTLFEDRVWFRKVMSNRFLVYTGTISYGLYLLHKIPFDALQALSPIDSPTLEFGAGLLASYAAAILSWHVLERPFLKMKRFFDSPARPVEALGTPLAVSQR